MRRGPPYYQVEVRGGRFSKPRTLRAQSGFAAEQLAKELALANQDALVKLYLCWPRETGVHARTLMAAWQNGEPVPPFTTEEETDEADVL